MPQIVMISSVISLYLPSILSPHIAIIAAVVTATQIAVSAISDNIVISSLIHSSLFYARKKTSRATSLSRCVVVTL